MKNEIKKIVDHYDRNPENLIAILQEVQEHFGYISPEAVALLARELNHPESRIYGVATFYTQFKFVKPGKHLIRVCLGTACHVKGGDELLEVLSHELGIRPGETTEDGFFSLESVMCMGCCAVGPVLVVDDDIYGQMSPKKVGGILKIYQKRNKTGKGGKAAPDTGGEADV
jgi:NADH-quinone oxidoreductase subunit E